MTTAWTEDLLAARQGDAQNSQAADALQRLCGDYWFPVYAFIRRRGYSPESAEDLAQGFFLKLIDKNYLDDVDRTRGRFRTFLLASVKHFLANEFDRANAQKRGGNQRILPLDFADAELRYSASARNNWTAEALFDRQWALALLDRVIGGLADAYAAAGKEGLFEALRRRRLGANAGEPLEYRPEIADSLAKVPTDQNPSADYQF